MLPFFNLFPPSAAYIRQWFRSALVQIMAWRLFGAKPLSKPILSQLGTKFSEISYNSFRSRKCIWICTQQNLGQELGHQQTQCWTQSYHIKAENDGHHFPEDIFRCIFLKENEWISIKIPLKLVPKGPINNIPSLVQIMAWRWPGNKPLSEPMMVSLLMHICVTWPQWLTRLSLKVLYFIMANDIS